MSTNPRRAAGTRSRLRASDEAGKYYGQFMTDLDVNNARRAVEVARWGRLRWVIENSFKTQKRGGGDGFGLEHTFCKDEHASRAAHMLMQLAHNLWQVFESGIHCSMSGGVSPARRTRGSASLPRFCNFWKIAMLQAVVTEMWYNVGVLQGKAESEGQRYGKQGTTKEKGVR